MFKKQTIEDNAGRKHRVRGLYIGPIMTNILVRPLLSLAGGLMAALLLWAAAAISGWFFGFQSPIDSRLAKYMVVAFTLLFALPDSDEPEVVPLVHAAMVTWLGIRFRLYRTEGIYGWTGKRLGLGRSSKVSEYATSVPDADGKNGGFIFLGDIQIPIWNSATERDQITLSNVARDTSTVYANLLIVLKLADPYLWINSREPLIDVAERARTAFRTAVSFFIGTDIAAMKSVLVKLMGGFTVIAAFLHKNVDHYDRGAVLQDLGGRHIYKTINPDGFNEPTEIAGFRSTINTLASSIAPTMLAAVTDSDGNVLVELKTVDESLTEVTNAVGAVLLRASIGDVTMSEEVAKKANEAASEAAQRRAQLASARTAKAARDILTPSEAEARAPGYELATLIAAAQDNPNIKIVMVPGGDSLSRAAVAAGSQIGGNT